MTPSSKAFYKKEVLDMIIDNDYVVPSNPQKRMTRRGRTPITTPNPINTVWL